MIYFITCSYEMKKKSKQNYYKKVLQSNNAEITNITSQRIQSLNIESFEEINFL